MILAAGISHNSISLFGDTQIEDLPINYFCVSCSLSRACVLVHRTGGLAKWIGASSSVPGIAPPLVEAGELIADGGVLNNLPIDLVRADGAGRVLAVDVSPEVDLLMSSNYFGRPSAIEILKPGSVPGSEWPTPRRANIRAFFPFFSRQRFEQHSRDRGACKHADLLIDLPLGDYKFFDWAKIVDIIEIGRRTALEKLPAFMKLLNEPRGADTVPARSGEDSSARTGVPS